MAVGPCAVRRIVCCLVSWLVCGALYVPDVTLSVIEHVIAPATGTPFRRGFESDMGRSAAWGQSDRKGADVTGAGAMAGVRVQQPGDWTTVAFEAINPGDEPAELTASFHFRNYPTRKFTRRVWLPPRSRRITLCPLLVPEPDPAGPYELICTVMDVTTGTPRLLPDSSGMLQRSALLSGIFDPVTTVLLPESEHVVAPWEIADEASDVVIAARLAAGQTRRLTEIGRSLLPDLSLYLETMDQLVLSNDTLFSDAEMTAAVRRWLMEGGSLWVMLDRTDFDEVGRLLGNAWRCSEVGRVDLTEVELEPVQPGLIAGSKREFENPVEFVRVVLEDARVLYRCQGWPAAFVQDFGRGRVVFTTLGSRGWTRPAEVGELQGIGSLYHAEKLGVVELRELATQMFAARPQHPVIADDLRIYLAKRIGYQIVSRAPVLVILGLFVISLAASGTWLWRVGRQPQLAAVAPLLALAAALPIAVLGMTTQRAIPETVAEAQVIQVIPEHDAAHVRGGMAFYHQTPTVLEASGTGKGYFLPDASDQDGTIQEMVWRDGDQWEWPNVRVPAGVQTGRFEQTVPLDSVCRAEVTFTPRGVEGRLIGGPWKQPEDPLIVAPRTRGMVARWGSEGSFQSGPGDLLGPDQFIGSGIMSDEQQRRQELLRSVFSRRGRSEFPNEPMLLFWSDPLPIPYRFAEQARRAGVALVQVPLTLRRPEANSPITIPSTFLPYRSVAGPGGRGVAPTYRAATGEWVRATSSSDTWLRVHVPEVLLPLRVDRLRGHLQIRAPSRRLDIAGMVVEGQVEVIDSRSQPSGLIEFTIDRPELLRLDEEGSLMIGLLVSEALTAEAASAEWKVDDLQLTVEAWTE
jgi:hypothetical protein